MSKNSNGTKSGGVSHCRERKENPSFRTLERSVEKWANNCLYIVALIVFSKALPPPPLWLLLYPFSLPSCGFLSIQPLKYDTHAPVPFFLQPSCLLFFLFSPLEISFSALPMLQVKILVNGEERISPWASYVLQPPRENQVTFYTCTLSVRRIIFGYLEGI